MEGEEMMRIVLTAMTGLMIYLGSQFAFADPIKLPPNDVGVSLGENDKAIIEDNLDQYRAQIASDDASIFNVKVALQLPAPFDLEAPMQIIFIVSDPDGEQILKDRFELAPVEDFKIPSESSLNRSDVSTTIFSMKDSDRSRATQLDMRLKAIRANNPGANELTTNFWFNTCVPPNKSAPDQLSVSLFIQFNADESFINPIPEMVFDRYAKRAPDNWNTCP